MKMMMRALLTLLFLASLSHATNKNVGTSGAQFLKIGAGARPTAMGEAFVGLADDVNAVFYNPAGISYIDRPELIALHTEWAQGMNYDFGAFVYPTNYGAFGFSAATLKVEDLEKRNESESLEGTFEAMDSAYTVTYARNVTSRLSLGASLFYLYQEIDTAKASAFSGNLGLVYRATTRPLNVGISVKNMGQEVKFRDEADPLPFTVQEGISYRLFQERFKVGFDLKHSRDNDLQYAVGGEYSQMLNRDFKAAFRGGFNDYHADTGGTNGYSFGAGLTFRRFSFDFAWVPLGVLGNSFRYSALLRF